MLRKSTAENFDFDDVILIPKMGVLQSRSEADTSVRFGKHTFALPVIPANMSSIVDESTCRALAERDYLYIMHRFDIDPFKFIESQNGLGLFSSISIGISGSHYELLTQMLDKGMKPDYITLDVAHGDSTESLKMVRHIANKFPDTFLIAGNIGTPDAALRLTDAGAGAVKVGIGPGSACLTSPNTGFGTRGYQLSALAYVAQALEGSGVQIISDGGIRKHGDIAKAVAFGADMVMIGGMLGGHDENPGEIIEIDGEKKKSFYGSASAEQKGNNKHVEGKKMLVPYKGSLFGTLQGIKENLQSSISYAGGAQLFDLRDVEYTLLRSSDRLNN